MLRRLRQNFGSVRVSNAREAFIAKAVRGVEDEPRLLISHAGEYYRVCCPFCCDTRFRLYVNHMFGQLDGHGRRMTFLAVCFNEGCLSRGENMQLFLERLSDTGWLEEARIREGKVVSEEAREVMWPGPCKLLSKLEPHHDAVHYVAGRGFDPEELSEKFHVSFCTSSNYFLAQNRIIIPVYEKGKLKGWQARYIGELPWKDKAQKKDLPPKYFSCPNSDFRSKCIYNLDRMREWQTGVIVEGPTDVWRGGSMFGCIFGNTVTDMQRRKLLAVFKKRTLVLCLDPEEFESHSTQRTITQFEDRMGSRNFAAVRLPEGTDPGSLGRNYLKEYIREEAARQGVKVVYKLLK